MSQRQTEWCVVKILRFYPPEAVLFVTHNQTKVAASLHLPFCTLLGFKEVNSNAVLLSPKRLGDGEANNVVPSSFCRMCVFVCGCAEVV